MAGTRRAAPRGMAVNHKRVVRIMREDNLLGVHPRAIVVTTNSRYKLEVYLNLAGQMKLTGVNLLWVAGIIYSFSGRLNGFWR
jgi:putative transposase